MEEKYVKNLESDRRSTGRNNLEADGIKSGCAVYHPTEE
jgi:hypothetical protein